MSKWKIVPAVATPEMYEEGEREFAFGNEADDAYKAMLAAAPAWEPSDEQIAVALTVYSSACGTSEQAMRAALKAAIGGGS